ncbi:MAG: phytase [Bacteroidota bacterium]
MLRSSLPLLLTGLLGCQTALPEPPITVDAATTEAREDSLALVAAYAARELIKPTVSVLRETVAARAQETADAADDPAIWIHPTDPARSLIFGSNKTGGLAAYNLSGQEVSYYPLGKINNVDILTGVVLGGERIDLLGCTNRSDQSVDLLRIDPVTGDLTDVAIDELAVDQKNRRRLRFLLWSRCDYRDRLRHPEREERYPATVSPT